MLIASCGGDDPPPAANLSFSESSVTYNEADEMIEVEVTLDRPATEDITIDYELSGTAQDEATASQLTDYPDYYIIEDLSDYGEIEIEKGETTGVIQIQLYSDYEYEDTETIEIEIQDVDSESVVITNADDIEISIEQEDGLFILLEWDAAHTDVDMDLFLWAEDITGTLFLTDVYSAREATSPRYEFLFIPSVVNDGDYGVSCNYYSGSADPMNFTLSYIKLTNGVEGTPVEKAGQYTIANINPWYTSGNDPILVATYSKAGNNYSNFTDITVPVDGSRTINKFSNLKLHKGIGSKVIK
jgi:hypothetical protein